MEGRGCVEPFPSWILRADVRIGGPDTDSRGTVLVRLKNRGVR